MKSSEDTSGALAQFSNTVKAALPRIIVKKLDTLTHDLADEIRADSPGYGGAIEAVKIAIKVALMTLPGHDGAEQPVSEPTLAFMITKVEGLMPIDEIGALIEIDEPAFLTLRDEWEKDIDISPFIDREK